MKDLLLAAAVILLSWGTGFYLDVKTTFDIAAAYWFIGAIGGAVSSMLYVKSLTEV